MRPRTGGRYAATEAQRRRRIDAAEARIRRLEAELDERALDRKGIPEAQRPAWRRTFAVDRTATRALLDARPDVETAAVTRELSDDEYRAVAAARLNLDPGSVV